MTGLYLIEGLPCSGKSTTARYVADCLAKAGQRAVYVDEGSGNHPADYELHAYVGRGALASLPERLGERVREQGVAKGDGWLVALSRFSGRELDLLLPFKIYDGLPWEQEMPLMLDKWESFVQKAEKGVGYVFNSVLLQNPMCETMMRFGQPQEQSFAFVSGILRRAAPLKPAVLYLKNDSIAQSIRSAAPERPGWLDGVIAYHENGAYGRSIRAQGFEGYVACLEERQRRELAILAQLPVKSLVLENPQQDWAGAYERIAGFVAASWGGER